MTIACSASRQATAPLLSALISFTPSGEVAGNLRETEQRARCIVHGLHDHARPEPAAVLAKSPALLLDTALCQRGQENSFADACAHFLFGVEAGKVLADDLGRQVALDFLGPEIPGGDEALRVKHEDRVIFDALQ